MEWRWRSTSRPPRPRLTTGYEALALKLATEPLLLQGFAAKLAARRDTCPLFDIDRFRRHMEGAYTTMRECHLRGEPPEDFAVMAIEA